jgi:hypothetical protein
MTELAKKTNTRPERERRTRRITFRLSEPEYAHIMDELEICGLSVSALARCRLLGTRVASKADLAVLGELRRLGGLFKHSYTETGGVYSELTAQAIMDISNCVKTLAERTSKQDSKEDSVR